MAVSQLSLSRFTCRPSRPTRSGPNGGPFGNSDLFIRWSQVNRDTCTWAFRNDTSRTLVIMNFNIDDTNADTGVAEHTMDVLPTLRPGQALGGWTAFSATANCSTVHLTATHIQWQ